MGKYGIGAKVRDRDGDEAEVVGKPSKGVRRIRLLSRWPGVEYDAPKSSLTADNDNASISAETSVSSYSGDAAETDKTWVPKVGDRVRVVDEAGGGKIGDECTVTRVKRPNEDDGDIYCNLTGLSGGGEGLYSHRLEPVVAPATTTWAPVAGKFGKTRDGRKVGPLGTFGSQRGHLSGHVDGDSGGDRVFRTDGVHEYGETNLDLVAEWVEPPVSEVAEVAVAEATATVPESKFGFTVGDRVRPVAEEAERVNSHYDRLFAGGYGKSDGTYFVRGFTGSEVGISGKNDGDPACYWYPVRFESAAPPAKFKVGDRVVALEGTCLLNVGQEYEVLSYEREGRVVVHVDVNGSPIENAYNEDWFALLTDHLTIGSTVTFTATGRLSAINDNGHMQVTFPGLEPGQNSFALPAKYVSLAH